MAGEADSRKGKKPRLMGPVNAFTPDFQKYAKQLDATNERRERIVKASRDVTYNSKKVIFQIHRMDATNKQAVLEQAQKDLGSVQQNHVQRIANELQGLDYWRFRRSFSPGIQEFVEAATFLKYCQTGTLLTLNELNEYISSVKDSANAPFTVTLTDYLLGLGDLTGELMRLAISGVAARDKTSAIAACNLVRSVFEGFSLLPNDIDRDMGKKMETMLQSLTKIENACYMMHLRGSEYPLDLVSLETNDEGD